jgi:hypothetical protein
MKRCFVLLICILHTLAAEEDQDFSLVNLTKSPIPRVAGTVNIVTGNWVDQSIHQETTGPDPYLVAHSYISSSLEEGSLADGWDLYHPSELEVYQPRGIIYIQKGLSATTEGAEESAVVPFAMIAKGRHHQKTEAPRKPPKPQKPQPPHRDSRADRYPLVTEDNAARLFYREAGGATFLFKGDDKAQHFHPKIHGTGYTHISSIDAPVRRDLRRTEIAWNRNHDEWVVKLGDGTKRTYARSNKQRRRPMRDQADFSKATYHIAEEVLPSGNKRWFRYDSDKELSSIQTVSSDGKHVLHCVNFHRSHDHVNVTTSEGLSTRFSLKKLNDHETAHVVDAIERPAKGKLSFSYCEKSPRHARRIDERKCSNGRRDIAKFYHEGRNTVGDEAVHITDGKKKKFLQNRVREIWTRQFSGDVPVVSHAFTYTEWPSHGRATVKEADGATTKYVWDDEHRPVWIGHETSSGRRLSSEHCVWGEGSDEGRLIRRTHLDNDKHPLLDHTFEFDRQGNVTTETLRGEFTGHSAKPLTIDDHDHVHGGETLSWKAKYTSDGRSLKKAEVDPLGNWTYFEYDDTRSLLTARFTCGVSGIPSKLPRHLDSVFLPQKLLYIL